MYSATNTNLHQIYQKAYKSLKACPKQFSHPSDLKELKFFGPSICKALEGKLLAYCGENALPVPEPAVQAPSARSTKRATTETDANTGTTTKKRKSQPWVPRFRSGGYAILLTLYHHDSINEGVGMNKAAIVRFAEALCDTSFKNNPKLGTFYSAWSSINTLLKNEMVYAEGARNGTYFITDDGKQLAEKLLQAERESRPPNPASAVIGEVDVTIRAPEISTPSRVGALRATTHVEDSSPNTLIRMQMAQMAPTVSSASSQLDGIAENSYRSSLWQAGSYSIQAIIDNREVRSSDDRDFFCNELNRLGTRASVAALVVGDCVWTAQNTVTKEVAVLDYILERKRLDDLIASIKDGRFKEQKARLKRSGLKHIIYLVEEPPGIERGAYNSQIQTAMAQAITLDDFFLKRTTSSEETVSYLDIVAKYLRDVIYKDVSLTVVHPSLQSARSYQIGLAKARKNHEMDNTKIGVAFDSFQTALSKSGMLTIRDIYIRMLLTVRGITLDKALAIQKQFSTPRDLIDAYKTLLEEDAKKMMLFNKLGNEINRKKITKMLSARVYEVWGKV